jgi:hypothetical protein
MKLKSWTISAIVFLIFACVSQNVFAWDFCGHCYDFECRSPGYWQNHPEEWPVRNITIGGETYTKEEAIEYMINPVVGNKWYTMFSALVAAKLNRASGCICCDAKYCIFLANNWMDYVNDAPYSGIVPANSKAWRYGGEAIYRCLDAFNNGQLCD